MVGRRMSRITSQELALLNELKQLSSEKRNPESNHLDDLSTRELLECINDQDAKVHLAVAKSIPEITLLVDSIVQSFQQGGRLIYIGAGTSGRLGILDAVECPPTFSVSHEQVLGLIAGGDGAMYRAVEGAEDSASQGVSDLKAVNVSSIDTVVGIAASGRTPYVMGALEYAKTINASTGAISCNKSAPIFTHADAAICALVGPEVLAGSTRMKSGTAQKMILNMLTTASMIKIGKTYKNLMVDVKASNEKLFARAINIVSEATGASEKDAKTALSKSKFKVKNAILMILASIDETTAEARLIEANGQLKLALSL